jgi:uncharacterized protein (DUF362 family)
MAKVSIVKGEKPDVSSALDLIDFTPEKLEMVVIKPNLSLPQPYYMGATTDLRILEQTILILREYADEIVVVESDGYEATADESFDKSGMKKLCDYHGINFVNLSRDVKIPVRRNFKAIKDNRVSKTILKADLFVNLPVMKTHSMTTVSLAMKNMLGIIPGAKKMYHPKLTEVICDAMKIRKPDLNIMDGIVGMEGNAPKEGELKRMDLVLASADALALDMTCCKIMRINPVHVDHLQKACYYGLGECNFDRIEVVGERIEDVSSKFRLS